MTQDVWLRLAAGVTMMVVVVGGIIWAVRRRPFPWTRRIPVELKNALAAVLAAGYGVEKAGVHLYPQGQGYAVLKFDGRGDVVEGEAAVDEVHGDLEKAIDRHFAVSGGRPPEAVQTVWGTINI